MIERTILDTAIKYSLFPEGSVITVAVSGGADSIALLYALHQLENKLKINVKAAHLNHLIRGNEALRDEEFVKNFCSALKIPLTVERINVPEFAIKNSMSLETAARKLRYEFLYRVNDGLIATAHTASDNLETVILNLTRGTAIDGLCGIPIRRDKIIRPILFATRDMIEDYCELKELKYVTDSTNLSDDYTRNKIRHKIVPVLKDINPKVEKSVLKTCQSVGTVSKMLKSEAQTYITENFANNTLNLSNFNKLNPEVAKKVIIEFVNIIFNDISLETCHIENIYKVCLNGGKTGIPKNKYCANRKGFLFVESEDKNTKKNNFTVKISKKSKKINNLLLNSSLDCDKIVGELVVRTRKAGDSIRLLNRGCTKPLTKLYNEFAIPLNIRNDLPVISDAEGVVWIHTIGVAQRCAVTKNTETVYEIEVEKNEF